MLNIKDLSNEEMIKNFNALSSIKIGFWLLIILSIFNWIVGLFVILKYTDNVLLFGELDVAMIWSLFSGGGFGILLFGMFILNNIQNNLQNSMYEKE